MSIWKEEHNIKQLLVLETVYKLLSAVFSQGNWQCLKTVCKKNYRIIPYKILIKKLNLIVMNKKLL